MFNNIMGGLLEALGFFPLLFMVIGTTAGIFVLQLGGHVDRLASPSDLLHGAHQCPGFYCRCLCWLHQRWIGHRNPAPDSRHRFQPRHNFRWIPHGSQWKAWTGTRYWYFCLSLWRSCLRSGAAHSCSAVVYLGHKVFTF